MTINQSTEVLRADLVIVCCLLHFNNIGSHGLQM